jgi:hypothetical protein
MAGAAMAVALGTAAVCETLCKLADLAGGDFSIGGCSVMTSW